MYAIINHKLLMHISNTTNTFPSNHCRRATALQMHSKAYLLLYTHFLFIHYTNAFNITCILNQYPSFSTFNRYLSQTNLTAEINSRKTITLLAVPNNAISRLSKQPHDVLKNILKVHVVLKYYDVKKLRNLANQTDQMTTLFQTTGLATGQQGLLKPTIFKNNIYIGSPTQAPGLGPILVRSIACEPCNLSVLSVTTAIVPAGISGIGSDSNSPMQSPTDGPEMSPLQQPVYVPRPPPIFAKPLPPALNPLPAAPSESPADAPKDSKESPVKPRDTPAARSPPKTAGPPATSGCRGASDFEIGVYVVLIMLLPSIYLMVQI